jgi:tetratricopeptide (TPR) repeat protein
MNRFLTFLGGVSIFLVACQSPPLTEVEVAEFVHSSASTQNQGDASVQPFLDGLASDFSFYNARFDSARMFDASVVTGDWFDMDTSYTDIQMIQIDANGATVYGINTDEYHGMRDAAKFMGHVVREDGKLVWSRWMHVNNSRMTTSMLEPTTESEEAEAHYWSFYKSMMRNDFNAAGLHADSALVDDPSLAMAYLGKMMKAGWVDGDAEAWQAAYDTGLAALDNETVAEKHFLTAFGLSGEERLGLALKALALAPQDPLMMSFCAYWLGDSEDSMVLLERALERWPYMGAFHNLMGYRLMADDDMEGAKEHFLLQTKFMGEAANPWDSLGDFYVAAGDKEEAIKCFEKALEIDPSFSASQEKIDELNGVAKSES